MRGDNEAIKSKEWEARRQVALVVSPAEATTSATGSLTSGGDHLSTNDNGHLCTGGLPATAAVSPRAERSSPPSSYRVRTRPSKNAAATSAAYDVLYNPLGGVRAVRSVAQGTLRTARPSPVRWTNSRAPFGGGRRC
jgi:hypothetical protein